MLLCIDSDVFCPTPMDEALLELMLLPCYIPPKPQKTPSAPAEVPKPPVVELDVDFEDSIEPPESTDEYAQALSALRLDTSAMQDRHSMTS